MSREGVVESTWFFIRFFNRILSVLAYGFAGGEAEYPANETGELLRRQVAQKSWFDKMTSWWVDRSIFGKIAYISSITVSAWLVGAILGYPLLLSAFSLLVSCFIHKLLSSHEEHRRSVANNTALEASALVQDLNLVHEHLESTVVNMNAHLEVLRTRSEEMSGLTNVLDVEGQLLVDNDASLLTTIQEVTSTSAKLHEQGLTVVKHMGDISNHMTSYDRNLTELTEKAANRGEELADFSSTVHDIRASQLDFSAAVTRFSLFVNAKPKVKEPIAIENDSDDDFARLRLENDVNERLMREWSFSTH